ncbi:hypothetical protein Anapl_14080 [Anas platyrhynchos]|uniref:Uncharacterized protein n=1 Tax=Anas platyrhynchos TaxID=8839 RepID=R0JYZ5_ANAPL|nr:hypothetical protein Anapl_14080 [Anas platyrhynchos]
MVVWKGISVQTTRVLLELTAAGIKKPGIQDWSPTAQPVTIPCAHMCSTRTVHPFVVLRLYMQGLNPTHPDASNPEGLSSYTAGKSSLNATYYCDAQTSNAPFGSISQFLVLLSRLPLSSKNASSNESKPFIKIKSERYRARISQRYGSEYQTKKTSSWINTFQ